MSEQDYLLAAIERTEHRAKAADAALSRYISGAYVPGNASHERELRNLRAAAREAHDHTEHLKRRLGWRAEATK